MGSPETSNTQRHLAIEQLDWCMLAIMGASNRPVDYLYMRAHLPKKLDILYRDNVLASLSEETTWHFGTAANQYIADRRGPGVEPASPLGFQLAEDLGEATYEKVLESVELEPENFSFVHEVFEQIIKEANTPIDHRLLH